MYDPATCNRGLKLGESDVYRRRKVKILRSTLNVCGLKALSYQNPNDNDNGTPAHGIFYSVRSCLTGSPSPAPMVSHFLCVSIVDDVVVVEFLGNHLKDSDVFGTVVWQGIGAGFATINCNTHISLTRGRA